jgi:hypothetical protein
VIKSRRMRWAAHVARTREKRDVYRVFAGNVRERDNLVDPGLDDSIILRWILRK